MKSAIRESADERATTQWGRIRAERKIVETDARASIPLTDLATALSDTDTTEQAADWLGVTEQTLSARIMRLTGAEEAFLDERVVVRGSPDEAGIRLPREVWSA